MAPFDLSALNGTVGYALIFGAIGVGFGATLEMSGFGDTRKLAAQFYLKDMTVLKVMFTAIVVASVLIFGATAFDLLDFSRVWVNPTYLWPGIVGGLIMGVGFVVGGFCPGTSLVSASTLKIDGMMFVLGALVGVYVFGESVSSFEAFWLSSAMGRFTLSDWLGLPVGVTLLLVVCMALVMFWGAEIAERFFGAHEPWSQISLRPRSLRKLTAAATLAGLAVVVLARGQPGPEKRWSFMAPEAQKRIDDRSIFVSPAEVVALRQDPAVTVRVLDLRSEHDFNLFHLGGAERVDSAQLMSPAILRPLQEQLASSVTFLVGNGETAALAAYKAVKSQGVTNLYVIEGGVNRWLELYPVPECVAERPPGLVAIGDTLAYRFAYAAGESLPAARPELLVSQQFRAPCGDWMAASKRHSAWSAHTFTKKVQLEVKKIVKGGCG
jgi:hypothetical protein